MKLDLHARRAGEDALIHRTDLRPAALDAAERIIHGDVWGILPVLGHQSQIAAIEGTVELHQRLLGFAERDRVLAAGDRHFDRLL